MVAPARAHSVEKTAPCIARQPILTADESVIGYELFFRENPEQRLPALDGENATSAIIDMLNTVGLRVLCDGRLAFINCTVQMLLSDYFALLPPNDVVIEIQETVPVNEDVILACQRIKQAGFSIALDNFVPDDPRDALVPYARFIKVDTSRVGLESSAALAGIYGNEQCRMLALGMDTRGQFLSATQSGFTRFQGYFFRHPENLQYRQIPANQATYMRLLAAASKPEIDFDELEKLIKHEPSLCYRLLRYLNSPIMALSSPVHSIRNALNLLGEQESIRWIRMATTLVMGQGKSSDLVLSSLVRARFCELLTPKVAHGDADLFLLGMLSLIDAILSVPIGVVIEELSLKTDIKAQLLSAKTGKKTALSPVYDLMLAREVGDWEQVTRLAKQLNLSLSQIAEISNQAMRWAHEIITAGGPDPTS
jgi:c-di-GMP-related signal transduction protein